MDGPFQPVPVYDDLDDIALPELSDGTARERFGPDVADADARADATEAGIGNESYVFAPGDILRGP